MKKIDYIDILEADLHVVYSQICTCHPEWRWDSLRNGWDGTVLWLVTGGDGRMKTPVGEFHLHAGACFCIPMDEEFIGSHDSGDPISVIAVHFISERLQKRLDRHGVVGELTEFRGMLERVFREWRSGHQECAAFWLRAGLMAFRDATAPVRGGVGSFTQLCRKIRNAPEALYDLTDLAAEHGCTLDHFIRRFKSATGRTPGQYILDERMEKAKELLMLSSLSVGDISRSLGYRDPYFFSRQFRQRVGVSPRDFRAHRVG